MYQELRREVGLTNFNLKNNEERLLWIRQKVKEYFGIRSVLVFYEGHKLADIESDNQYCLNIQKDSLSARRCRVTKSLAEIKTLSELKPMCFSCHVGLINFTIPVMYKKEVIGVLVCGSFRPEDNETAVAVKRISEECTPIWRNQKKNEAICERRTDNLCRSKFANGNYKSFR